MKSGDLNRALRAYVAGHDRVWSHGRKVGGSPGQPPGGPGPDANDLEFGGEPAPLEFGVGVAEELDFRRGPASDPS